MAEKSYYLEKAKLEKEGLDPVSLLPGISLLHKERHLTAHIVLCVGGSFNCRFQFVFLLRRACKEAVCEAPVSCFHFLFSKR